MSKLRVYDNPTEWTAEQRAEWERGERPTWEIRPPWESQSNLGNIDQKVFDGFRLMHKYAMDPKGAIPLKYRHLIFVVIGVQTGNEYGAFRHLHSAMKDGLTVEELKEALAIGIMTTGVIPYTKLGMRLLSEAQEVEAAK